MKISTKGRYALRMLIDLAEHQGDGFIALKDIAERQKISKKYLEQIVPVFNKSDFLRTNRGFQGGYRLAKSPEKYTVGEILRLTEGSLAPVACLDHTPVECERSRECETLPIWQGLYKVINNYLDGITLQDILDSTPLLYQLQPLSGLLQVVLDQIRRMLPNASACVYLGGVPSMEIPPVYQGIGRYESNLCLAREWYLKLADQEYVPAQRNMAERQLVLPLYNEHHQIEGIFLLDLPDGFPEHGLTLLEVYAKQVAAAISNITLHLLVNQKNEALNQAYAKLRDNYLEVIQAIRALVDAKDIYTRGHSDRVSYFADLVAQALGKDEAYRERIRVAGLFHDIGKIGTADQLLNKQSRLTAEEYEEIQLHPQRGSEILSAVSTFRPIAPIVECHHERFDGRGYPNGLSGEDIPEESRIISVVDAFDAMTSDRLYRSSIGIERAKEELKNGRGTQFDPRIVDVFLTILHEYDRVQEKIAWTYATIPQDSSSPQLP